MIPLRIVPADSALRATVVHQLWVEYRDGLAEWAERHGGCA